MQTMFNFYRSRGLQQQSRILRDWNITRRTAFSEVLQRKPMASWSQDTSQCPSMTRRKVRASGDAHRYSVPASRRVMAYSCNPCG